MTNNTEKNIQHIKDCVIRIRNKECALEDSTSIWQGCMNVLSYMLDLSPTSLRNVRLHTEIFNGEYLSSILFTAHSNNPDRYAESTGYAYAAEHLDKKYWISEPLIDGWVNTNGVYGCKYKERVINPEIGRYQLYFENFVSTGMLDTIEQSATKSVVMEIGSGYGAIGHHLLNMAKQKVCYIVLDLPLMLLYTGCYIATHHPDAKIFIYDPDNEAHQTLDDSIFDYDLVLIPSHRLSILKNISKIDYAINTISMAEMTTNQIQEYVDFIKLKLKHYFYYQNYNWTMDKPLHYFVGEQFHAHPRLDFYTDHNKQSGIPLYDNYTSTFIFTTSKTMHHSLNKAKIKIRLPSALPAQLSFEDESITIRKAPNKYKAFSSLSSRCISFLASLLPVDKVLKAKIGRKIYNLI